MQIIIDIFNTFFFAPIINLLVFILNFLLSINLPGALGFAIIILTILIRLVVWPFMTTQLKSAKKMAELKPRLDELKNQHKDDKKALSSAQMALYKEHGINPAGGCLPSLIQLPIVIALYQAILALFSGNGGVEKVNNLLYLPSWKLQSLPDSSFFGLNLAAKPADFGIFTLAAFSIPLITAGLTFIQSKMMAPKPLKEYPSDSPKEKKEKGSTEDAMQAMQSQMTYLMPVMIGYFAFQFPIGLALYWNTFTILGIVQQYLLSGWGGLEGWIKLLKNSLCNQNTA